MGSFHIGKRSVAVLAVFLATTPALPQASTAIIRGTVRDQAQAVVPGARVLLTNTATNLSRSVLSNEAGLFVFPGTIPGPYRIDVESPGMQKFEANLVVQVQQDATLDVVLQVGQAVTQVDVKDATPL